MRVFRFIFALGCLFPLSIMFVSSPAFSDEGACYTLTEAEAEQGIRIHSELMVVGLNCSHMSDGKNLYTEHQKFTAKHEELFASYEKIMMGYLKRNGEKDPEQALHSMRTEFANKISGDAAAMRPDFFCKNYAKRIEKASKMDDETLRNWAATPFPGHPLSREICEKDK